MKRVLTSALMFFAVHAGQGIAGVSQSLPASENERLLSAVLLVRGSVAGNAVGSFGVFTRSGEDTVWSRATKAKLLAFGLGLFDNGRTRRYYIAGGSGVHRSTDGGLSWKIITSWRTEEVLCVVPDPVDSAVVYIATPFGVFKTIDDGLTWVRKMNGFASWYVQRIVMDHRDRSTLYAATERDLFKTTDAGETWKPMRTGVENLLAVLQHPSNGDVILISGEDQGVLRTTDGGKSWSNTKGLGNATVYTFRASSSGEELYAAGWRTGLWRSTDNGESWKQVWGGPETEALYSIFVHPRDPRHLMVGTVGLGIYESLDHGETWRYAGLRGAQVKQIELYP